MSTSSTGHQISSVIWVFDGSSKSSGLMAFNILAESTILELKLLISNRIGTPLSRLTLYNSDGNYLDERYTIGHYDWYLPNSSSANTKYRVVLVVQTID